MGERLNLKKISSRWQLPSYNHDFAAEQSMEDPDHARITIVSE